MNAESPQFRKCCFCLPLRRGLIGWGYFKLALCVLVVIDILMQYVIIAEISIYEMDILGAAAIIFFLIDAVFSMLLIVAGQKKNPKLLRVSFIYNIAWLVPVLGLAGFKTYLDFWQMIKVWRTWRAWKIDIFLRDMIFMFTITLVQVYVILLIRSEEIKLRKQTLEKLCVNIENEGEPRCVCTDNGKNVSDKLKNDKHDKYVQSSDNGHDNNV